MGKCVGNRLPADRKGRIISGITLADALEQLDIAPDVKGSGPLWLHRKTENADWYFVTVPKDKSFQGELDFRNSGHAEIWDPLTGDVLPAIYEKKGDRTSVKISLPQAGSYFVVFRKDNPEIPAKSAVEKQVIATIPSQPAMGTQIPGRIGNTCISSDI